MGKWLYALAVTLAVIGGLWWAWSSERQARLDAEAIAQSAIEGQRRQRAISGALARQEFELRDEDAAAARVNRLNRAFGLCDESDHDCGAR